MNSGDFTIIQTWREIKLVILLIYDGKLYNVSDRLQISLNSL